MKLHPQWIGKVKLFQICLPPADFLGDKQKYKKEMRRQHPPTENGEEEDLSGVQELRSQINMYTHPHFPLLPHTQYNLTLFFRLVGRINGELSSADFTPIYYSTKDLESFEEVAALYAACDAALITPLREGMNLT